MMYYLGKGNICPICGGKIKHPYTGTVSIEQIEEDIFTCIWMEVCDGGGGTIGYTPICKKNNWKEKEGGQ